MKFLNVEPCFYANWVTFTVKLQDVETVVFGKMRFGMDFRSGWFVLSPCSKIKRMSGLERSKMFVDLSSIDPNKHLGGYLYSKVTWEEFMMLAKEFCGVHNCPMCNEFIPSNKRFCSDKCRVKAHRTRVKTDKAQLVLNGVGGI